MVIPGCKTFRTWLSSNIPGKVVRSPSGSDINLHGAGYLTNKDGPLRESSPKLHMSAVFTTKCPFLVFTLW